jgi:broad specificity phosphatase PhoE
MLEILLIRHGETDWNVSRCVMGMQPIGLNDAGRAQITALAQGLAGLAPEALYASPANRTRESADILSAHHGQLPIVEDAAFGEIDYGDWVGLPFTDFEGTQDFTDYMFRPSHCAIPGGERPSEAQARAVAGVERIRSTHATGRVGIVSHADVIKALLVHYQGRSLDEWQQARIDNASMTIMSFRGTYVRVLGVNIYPGWARLFRKDALEPHEP